MNAKLSPLMLDVLRTIDSRAVGSVRDHNRTVRVLWRRGLIKDVIEEGRWVRYALTPEGKLALKHGRQMLTRRQPP